MNKKIGIGKWMLVFVLTLFVIPSIILSMFVLPTEMIVLNRDTYMKVVEDDQYVDQMPPVIAEVVTDQVLLINDVPSVLANRQSFKEIFAQYIQKTWAQEVLFDLVGNTLDYFNFKTPYATIEIGIEDLKDSIVSNSTDIADDYVLSLESCQNQDVLLAETATNINELPPCKPEIDGRAVMSRFLAVYLEDKVNRLPNTLNLVGLIPSGMILGERTFYWYSIARWLFRMLPFSVLILLILIALLLKPNKKIMRGWTGWVLMGVAGVVLLSSVVLLIGLDQFLGLIFNQPFSMLIAGFGNVLLSVAHHLGNRVLEWVMAQASAIFLFGLILMLAGKYSKDRQPDQNEDKFDTSEMPAQTVEKAIVPQTLEEIEEAEEDNSGLE